MEKNQIGNNQDLEELVRQRYSKLALDAKELKGCYCDGDPLTASKKAFTIVSEGYTNLRGYEPDVDLGVGCGPPTQYANISEDDIAVDLSLGARNDCFTARAEVDEGGKVIGVDFPPQMITKVRSNTLKRGYVNMEFLGGDIENMSLLDNTADIVVSNCILNLLPEKNITFKETYHALKPDEHFCISNVVLNGTLLKKFTDNAATYAGRIANAVQKEDYLQEVERTNLVDIRIARTRTVLIPDEVLYEHLDEDTTRKYKSGDVGIYSITVTGEERSV